MIETEDTCPKTGLSVLDVLIPKHPEYCPPSAHSLEAYRGKPPEKVPVGITDATVATVARQLSGSAGLEGGVESISLHHWLLRFGVASIGLQ